VSIFEQHALRGERVDRRRARRFRAVAAQMIRAQRVDAHEQHVGASRAAVFRHAALRARECCQHQQREQPEQRGVRRLLAEEGACGDERAAEREPVRRPLQRAVDELAREHEHVERGGEAEQGPPGRSAREERLPGEQFAQGERERGRGEGDGERERRALAAERERCDGGDRAQSGARGRLRGAVLRAARQGAREQHAERGEQRAGERESDALERDELRRPLHVARVVQGEDLGALEQTDERAAEGAERARPGESQAQRLEAHGGRRRAPGCGLRLALRRVCVGVDRGRVGHRGAPLEAGEDSSSRRARSLARAPPLAAARAESVGCAAT
jgi:hypothetical protein